MLCTTPKPKGFFSAQLKELRQSQPSLSTEKYAERVNGLSQRLKRHVENYGTHGSPFKTNAKGGAPRLISDKQMNEIFTAVEARSKRSFDNTTDDKLLGEWLQEAYKKTLRDANSAYQLTALDEKV